MKLMILIFGFYTIINAQNKLEVVVTDRESGESLQGVAVIIKELQMGAASDDTGKVIIQNIPNGNYTAVVSYLGYEDKEFSISFPGEHGIMQIALMPHEEELEEIFISSNRTSRTIDDIPLRVEVVAGEEIEEKMNMEPGNISMLLNESTGIQIQQTSSVTNSSEIKIQGLPGKYTQLLKDGFPLYSGFSGGLSLLQIPPLDLYQVEIVKGAVSTLYGQGAMAGLVNLISKTPSEDPALSLLLNQTSAGGTDASAFYSIRNNSIGSTILFAYDYQRRKDIDSDSFTDIPYSNRFNFNPKLFFYFNETSNLSAAFNISHEEREGGFIPALSNPLLGYFEKIKTKRYSTQLKYDNQFLTNGKFTLKNSFSLFNQKAASHSGPFKGEEFLSYTETALLLNFESRDLVFGLNVNTSNFQLPDSLYSRSNNVIGFFVLDNWYISESIGLESGLRADITKSYGNFYLPHISIIYRVSEDLHFRLGGGTGYKLPDYSGLDSLTFVDNSELSLGANFDLNYSTILFEDIVFNLNQAFYLTRIKDPVLDGAAIQDELFTRGLETNLKLSFHQLKLLGGYTFIYAEVRNKNNSMLLNLTPKHRLGLVLILESHESYRIGLESYFTSRQKINNNLFSEPYWIFGLMAEKNFGFASIFINFENFTNTRQSKFSRVVEGTPFNPIFNEIWAPLEGFVINGGVKLRL